LVENAEVLIGGARHLACVPQDDRERLTWTSPLKGLIDDILSRRSRRVTVLATGDPLHYGIGVTLARHVPIAEMTILPAPSSFSLACARLGWPMAKVRCLTLHGRPLDLIQADIQPDARLLALSDNGATPAAVARLLADRGYGRSRLAVFEHMGGPKERRIEGEARSFDNNAIADFNTVAVECIADPGTPILSRTPGLPDDAFRHDGQITKREMRAITLAALRPVPGQMLWDVGAGCGSVAIEWMRVDPANRAIAIERNPSRLRLIADNASALGAARLEIVSGEAPEALSMFAPPDAVFIGGGVSREALIAFSWDRLKPGGRLVANAVSLESEAVLLDWRKRTGGELIRVGIERAEALESFTGWRPLRPVAQLAAVKR
jgi:precorrin-6Y C5,15-methyltransferase (decarboxylating)